MVCIYCGHKTRVTNSRLQKRSNSIWRRRACPSCKSVFTSIEEPNKYSSWRVAKASGLEPYSHDKLFISIYESCKHRPNSLADARALTETILNKLTRESSTGLIQIDNLKKTALGALKNFDAAAMVHYQAYYL